jgi:hypothetical protein
MILSIKLVPPPTTILTVNVAGPLPDRRRPARPEARGFT